jgi:GNAT superfamily N-acetyltransferase
MTRIGPGSDPQAAPREQVAGQLRLRRAAPADARVIAELAVSGWRAAYTAILPADYLAGLSIDARETAWRHMLDPTGGREMSAWIAELDGVPAGFVSCGPPRDADQARPTAEVYALYVRPDLLGRGAGRALLDRAVGHLRKDGAADLVLWVFEANSPARAFYEAMGWRPDGARQELDLGGTRAIEVRYRLAAG